MRSVMTFGSPKKTDSLLHGSSGSTSRPSVIRPLPVRLQERTCWQALYQASPPPSSAQEKRGRGRSNSLPIPDEAPVTSAQGPNLLLSSATVIFSLRSASLGFVVFVVFVVS